METDFFARQDEARRRTWVLVLYFMLGVLGLMVLFYLPSLFFLFLAPDLDHSLMEVLILLVLTFGYTFLIIVFGSLWKIWRLRKGGGAVAAMLGGVRVEPDTREPLERRFVDVVQEMAIASGMAVPEMYVLPEEPSINAFAAGYSGKRGGDAVVCVTRGALELLSREELMGVVAHEFSHIANGDMRLKTRLMGWTHGLTLMGGFGYWFYRRVKRAGCSMAGFLFSFGPLAIGMGALGAFFGNRMKAAVSRQREYLADASAVQYTRSPHGIAGALKKIGGQAGAGLQAAEAYQANHLYFSQGVFSALPGLKASHPPLAKRIRRLEPEWDGRFVTPVPGAGSGAAAPDAEAEMPEVSHARGLIDGLPPVVREMATGPLSAQALLLGLLLGPDTEQAGRQMEYAETRWPEMSGPLARARGEVQGLDPAQRLCALDICLPMLRQLSGADAGRFQETVSAFIRMDGKLSLFEWMMHRVILHGLAGPEQRAKGGGKRDRESLRPHMALLLSAFARAGGGNDEERDQVFLRAANAAGLDGVSRLPASECTFSGMGKALDALRRAPAAWREQLLAGCEAAVRHDGTVDPVEAQLFRATAASLDVPAPLLLPGTLSKG